MRKKYIALSLLFGGLSASAQIDVTGTASVAGGLGQANPWDASMNLDIKKEGKFSINPFVRAYGINRFASEADEKIDFTYTGIMPLSENAGNRYTSNRRTDANGWALDCGVQMQFTPNKHNLFKINVESIDLFKDVHGSQTEQAWKADGTLLSSVRTSIWDPEQNKATQTASALYQYKTNMEGESITLQYKITHDTYDYRHYLTVDDHTNFSLFGKDSELSSNATINHHDAQVDWLRPVAKGHSVNLGARYEERDIHLTDEQFFDGVQVLKEPFDHRYYTVGAFAAYNLKWKGLTAMARLEYDYTRQQGNDLNDLVPTARVQWQIDKKNSLMALYGRRIVRAGYDLLNPAHIKGAYTEYYGNAGLVGMHANNVQLAYTLKTQPLDFKATLQHIFADDGFNAIWMERNNVRISTWGNEGKRRAWGLTPDVTWRLCDETTLQTNATLLWDKRVADAIHMAKEHWGITAHLGLKQQLPWSLQLTASADYSEGNTLDLYSHEGRSWGTNVGLQRSFGKLATLGLEYYYKESPTICITQGGYTGIIDSDLTHRHAALLKLTVRF